jgi:hypothetical protein
MKRIFLTMAAALMLLIPSSAPAAVRGFGGGRVFVGGGYWGPYYGYSPYWGGYYGYPNSREIKLDTKVKDAQVFINGAFAGTTQRLRVIGATSHSLHLADLHGQLLPHDKINE